MREQQYPFHYSTKDPPWMAVGDVNGEGQNDVVDASGTGVTTLYYQ